MAEIVVEWVTYLREVCLWGNDDPLFPATKVGLDPLHQFHAVGLTRDHWSTAEPIREVFRGAFGAAGLPYFNPHSLRNTLVQVGQALCQTPEEFKAWSQNLGHEGVLTTFSSYGAVATTRQGEIMRDLGKHRRGTVPSAEDIADALARRFGSSGRWDVEGAADRRILAIDGGQLWGQREDVAW